MEDEYIESLSGAAGGLAAHASFCGGLNDKLTKAMDAWYGDPNKTDTFDASCNTCKHFERKPMTAVEKAERNVFGMPGRCELKDISATGWQRGQFCGFENAECYVNRRLGLRPHELEKLGATNG